MLQCFDAVTWKQNKKTYINYKQSVVFFEDKNKSVMFAAFFKTYNCNSPYGRGVIPLPFFYF
jgi:hypothetical protein